MGGRGWRWREDGHRGWQLGAGLADVRVGQGHLQQGWQPYQGVRVLDPPGRGEFGELELQAGRGGSDHLPRQEMCWHACDSRSIVETHYQLGVAQAHSGDYASAEKSLRAAISVLNSRISNLKKMEVSENITRELSDLETLIYEIKERTSDHKEMQRGTYKEDKDFVPMYNDVQEIVTRKSTITA